MLVSPANFESPNTAYEFNPEKAKQLLDEAGWVTDGASGVRSKDGVKLSVLFQTSANPVRQQTQAIVKKNLEAIGVDVRLTFFDSSIFFDADPDNINNRHHFYADMEMYATGNRSPDPGAYMQNWLCDEAAQKANNWTGLNKERWCDPTGTYDKLYKQSTRRRTRRSGGSLFVRMNDILVNDHVVIPLVRQADISGVSNRLAGRDAHPLGRGPVEHQGLEAGGAMKSGWLNNLKIGRKLTPGLRHPRPPDAVGDPAQLPRAAGGQRRRSSAPTKCACRPRCWRHARRRTCSACSPMCAATWRSATRSSATATARTRPPSRPGCARCWRRRPWCRRTDQTHLALLNDTYQKWSQYPERLFELRDDQLEREPAYAILATDGLAQGGQRS